MTKKYTYTRREREFEREIDRFLRDVNHTASSSKRPAPSVLDDLRAMAGEA